MSAQPARAALVALPLLACLCSNAVLGLAFRPHSDEAAWRSLGGSGQGLRFLRIQKTGGTTFGKSLMAQYCSPRELCRGIAHLDWNRVRAGGWTGPTVTLVRDPVERTMSEFAFLRTDEGRKLASHPQWNFRQNWTWFSSVVNAKANTDDALDVYLNPKSPSVNRQALYLLGFNASWPAHKYDWGRDRDALLDRAKAHLDALTVFGITDCYQASMKVIAQRLGWPEAAVLSHLSKRREASKNDVADKLRRSRAPRGRQGAKRTDGTWRQVMHPRIVQLIEAQNGLDMDIYRFARQRFEQKFGAACQV